MFKTVIATAIAALTIAAAVGLAATSASASDAKIYPGSMCTGTDITNDVFYSWNGSAFNRRSTGRVMHCPLVRDIVQGRISAAKVHVIDRHDAASVTCYLRSSDVDGNGGSWGSSASSGASFTSSAVKTLYPGLPSWEIGRGLHHVYCTSVPGMQNGYSSGITSYDIDEA